jgi:putative flippase GtrA
MFQKQELKFIFTFIKIGLFTTGLTYLLITLFSWLLANVIENISLRSSIAYFIGSFLMIGFSLFMHRKTTFKTLQRRHKSKIFTVMNYYLAYGITSIISSLVVLLLAGAVENQEIVKFLGLIVNTVLNYASQRLWIFTD